MTTAGTSVPVVADAVYLSNKKEVRLYLNKNIADYVSLTPYQVTSTGIKGTDGSVVSLSDKVYFTPENDCELYDISIANVWFKSGNKTLYSQPSAGPCDVFVRTVNSSDEEKTATLKIEAVKEDLGRRVLKEETIKLKTNEEVTTGFRDLSFSEGEKIEICLIK